MPNKKVTLFTNDDFIGIKLINKIVPIIKQAGLDVLIVNTGSNLNRNFKSPPPKDVSFYNMELYKKRLMPFLENAPPEKDEFDAPILSMDYTLNHLSEIHNIDVINVSDINASDFVSMISKDDNIIGGLSLRFLQTFEDQIINTMKDKGFFWNLHGGILPDYKGLLIPFWAAKNNESEYGWTLHEIDSHIDTGNIISIEKMPLDKNATILSTYMAMIPKAISMIGQSLHQHIHDAPINPISQEVAHSSYYPYPPADTYKESDMRYSTPKEAIQILADSFTYSSARKKQVVTLLSSAFNIPANDVNQNTQPAKIQALSL